ncbi:PaaI family thioesterase [Gordonia paraffinivorans]|uniref:PaaI family thioesterase n=1 Tax=Gordonia paraffinivorans TaxID=175628 RepID=UPI001C92DD8E|nr:hotdog fold thioesterase [Gordonia paraffinivorans]
MTVTDPPITFLPQVPEAIFGVMEIVGTSTAVVGRMRPGPWLRTDDGRPAPGAIGVLVDAAVGGAAVAHRPPGGWAVTTDLSIVFCAEIPADGPDLVVRGQTVHHGAAAGISTGSVYRDDRLVATVTERIAYVDAAPRPSAPAERASGLGGSALSSLGGSMTADGVRIEVGENATNPGGALHGGVSIYLAELAASSMVHRAAPGLSPTTLHISYTRPGKFGETIDFATEAHHLGCNSATVDVTATDTGGKVVTRARLTYHRR